MNTVTAQEQNTVKGFTLLELLVVIAISGIVLSVGLPAMGALIESNQFKAEVSAIHRAIALSRSMAVYRGESVSLCPLTGSNACGNDWTGRLTIFTDSNQNSALDSEEATIGVVSALKQPDTRLNRNHSRESAIMFRPNGSAFGHNGTLKICMHGSTERSATIIISGAGRIRLGEDKNNDGLVEDTSGNAVTCS
jgi:prepilin-type N-terminal cleavage/methylation domain-containing protein